MKKFRLHYVCDIDIPDWKIAQFKKLNEANWPLVKAIGVILDDGLAEIRHSASLNGFGIEWSNSWYETRESN